MLYSICNLINLNGNIPKSIKYFIAKENMNNDNDYGSKIVMIYNDKDFKEKI